MPLGRTPLFTRLSRLLRPSLARPTPRAALGRRELLKLTALGTASIGLPACGGSDDTPRPPAPSSVKVAVIGAGLAGLHCARRLQQAKVSVAVYEASNRVGGRTFTLQGAFPDGQLVELGGELVDTNHATMRALVDELELTLDDRQAEPVGTAEVWWIGGAAVPEETIVEQFSAVAERMLADLEAADEDEDAYTTLDETTLADYLADVVPAADYPELHAVLANAYRGEFGLEPEEQSALNLIYLIGSDEPDPFRIFGESDERYHIHEGSDAVAKGLAGKLGRAVVLGRRLVTVAEESDRFVLTFALAGGSRETVYAEHVVFALPFSVLRDVELDVTLSEEKRAIIDELGYGTNTKIMGAFRTRVWRTEHDASGSVTSDARFQQTWETSIGQDGPSGVLTNFLGGTTGAEGGASDAEAWFRGVVAELEPIFPGIEAEYVEGSARRMQWPTAPHFKGSYTCYLPGQWAFWGLEGVREGNLHFAGEHTSLDFQGWMEGAAETGAFAAAEVLTDLELDYPPELASILEDKLPQPTWGLGDPAPRRSPLTRRRTALRRAI
jgi:monoamine oxidase